VEMPGLWKAWKAKSRLPPLSTSPLEISPKAGDIPTFPQLRRRRRMEKCKTKSRFFTFPPPEYMCQKTNDPAAGASRRQMAERFAARVSDLGRLFQSHNSLVDRRRASLEIYRIATCLSPLVLVRE
jgi:hypothetical protein